jgi:SH3-like domain-containing protein
MACVATPSLFVAASTDATAQAQRPPYWASINREEAIMRRGPSTEMRAMWLYRRIDLPVRVIAIRDEWRQVEDPGGVRGWMHRRLLSGRRTAIVVDDIAAMHLSPEADAPVAYRAEPGVVGRLSECADGWCLFDVRGRTGYVRTTAIWGDEAP